MTIGPVKAALRVQFPSLFSLIRSIYRFPRDYWKPKPGCIQKEIEQFCRTTTRPITFVQIGANDGEDEFAPLRREFQWSGIMVEPQRRVFEQLVAKNQEGNIRFER